MEKNIVIIGAGYAGILTAKKLAKKLKKYEDVKITIIDKNPYHTMLTELHEVAANRVDEESIKIDLKKIFAKRKVDVKLDLVESIDFDGKKVVCKNETYAFDYLVIAAGSKPTFYGVEGADEFAYKLWSFEDSVVLKNRLHESFRLAEVETDLEIRERLLTFFVVGAGFTGVEMVGELAEYIPILCEKHDINRNEVKIFNVDVLTKSVPVLPDKYSKRVEKRLAKMGVTQLLGSKVDSIGEDFIQYERDGKIVRQSAGTVIWAAGIESADITAKAAKTLDSVNKGRIKTDSYLRSLSNEKVYVVGDNMYYIPESLNAPVPQMVENCEQSADIAAHNILAEITGKGEMKEYNPKFHGVMVSVGGRYGSAHVGPSGKFFGLPSFFAIIAKHFINIIYFIQILGWNKVFSYLKHEFFTIRNNRSIVGGHFSNKSPTFLLVPLRLWLGAVWLFEGIKKVADGWFTTPNLKNFFGYAQAFYDGILGDATAGASTVADAAAGATSDAVATAGTAFINWDIFGWFKILFVSGKDLAQSELGDFAFKIDVSFVNSIMEKIIFPSEGMQIFMQITIVVLEILVGLALIGGLFTTPAAAASLVLQAMFVTSTGLYLTQFWMVFAGVAMMFGAGRVFGLDYYVMPFLKRQWRKIPIVRKSYLYHD